MVSVESSTAFSRRSRTMLTARVATSAGSHARLASARTRTHHRSAPEPQDVGKRHVGTNLCPRTSRRLHRPPHDVWVAGMKAAGDVDSRNVSPISEFRLMRFTAVPPGCSWIHERTRLASEIESSSFRSASTASLVETASKLAISPGRIWPTWPRSALMTVAIFA